MDIEKARFNMIEQQVRPWDVLDADILESLAVIRREDFVPPAYRDLAFADVEIPLVIDGKHTGQFMSSPKLEARMLQSLGIHKHESALEIGTGSGYGTALLAQRTRRIQSWKSIRRCTRSPPKTCTGAGITDVRLHLGDGSKLEGDEKFDAIILSGSMARVPDDLLARLNDGGRLVAIVGEAPTMHGRLYLRAGKAFTSTDMFETVAPRLQGFPDGKHFRF